MVVGFSLMLKYRRLEHRKSNSALHPRHGFPGSYQ